MCRILLAVSLFFVSLVSFAEEVDKSPAFHEYVQSVLGVNSDKSPIIFTSPPRGVEKDKENFNPIIEFLEKELGRKIEYRVPTGWGDYSKAMINDVSDIVFDGPHFNSWRMNEKKHRIIVRLPRQQHWTIVVSADSHYSKLRDLEGRKVCLQGETNFGKLNFMNYFPNPMRLPEVVQVNSRQDGYSGVLAGKCVATIVTDKELLKFNELHAKNHTDKAAPVKVLRVLDPTPNQAFSVSSRLSEGEQLIIKRALLSDEGQKAAQSLRNRYAAGEKLVEAKETDYKNIAEVLNDSFPFYNPFGKSIEDAYGESK